MLACTVLGALRLALALPSVHLNAGAMNRDFDAVDKMLNPQLYPDWYPRISKLDALQEASLAPEFQGVPMFAKVNPTQPGFGFQRTPIAVTFGVSHLQVSCEHAKMS